jgi:Fe-S cluster assembly protein SufD
MSTLQSLSPEDIVEQAGARREPQWLVQRRLEAWEAFQRLPLPESRYTKIRGLELSEFSLAPRSPSKASDFASTREAVHIQLDGETLLTQVPEAVRAKGVLFCDLATAVREHPDLVQQYLFKAVSPHEDKMTALVGALAHQGIFVYIPKGTVLEEPLRLAYLLDEPGVAALAHQIVVVEPHSRVTLIEESYAKHPQAVGAHLHAAISEVYVGEERSCNLGLYRIGTKGRSVSCGAAPRWGVTPSSSGRWGGWADA